MRTTPDKLEAELASGKPANTKSPGIASASIHATLAAIQVNPETGPMHTEVDVRRKAHGYNKVVETTQREQI